MEEDIKILEQFKEFLISIRIPSCNFEKEIHAIENLINRVKENKESLEQKNSQIDFLCKEYDLMFDVINNLELYIDEVIKDDCDIINRLDGDDCDQELRFETEIETLQKVKDKLTIDGKYKEFIPKSKIREKIEELKERADEDNLDDFIKIDILQELMEDK